MAKGRPSASRARRDIRRPMAGMAVLVGIVVSLGWWLDAPLWRLPVTVFAWGAAGWLVAGIWSRDVRKARK